MKILGYYAIATLLLLSSLFACQNVDLPLNTNTEETEETTDESTNEEEEVIEETSEEDNQNQDSQENSGTLDLVANDLTLRPMQDIDRPEYLETIIDPSFGTTIRRITNAGDGNIIKPMYSTIQAWNADESLMILYDQSKGLHQLLNGMNYTFIRYLDDINPDDVEQLYWDFQNPDVLFYIDKNNADFIKYSVGSQSKTILANFRELSNCAGNIGSGNDVQMMSWDSDVISFRCDNSTAYSYRISTQKLTEFNVNEVAYTAPMPAPNGLQFYHNTNIYDTNGDFDKKLNEKKAEHSCLGKLVNGNNAHYAIAFAVGPNGGCAGNIIAHDLTTGECFPVISEAQGYDYAKSGTHISAVAHKNPGWIAASMMGFEQDGKRLLDQELILAKVSKSNVEVYRIGHHRADEDQFDYWGEPHAVISPKGTRVLFGSDWSGADDGKSVESYVVELSNFMN